MASRKIVASEEEARWVAQWKRASTALDRQRAAELLQMTPADAGSAIEAVLSFPLSAPLPKERQTHSGLVELQEYLKKLRSK